MRTAHQENPECRPGKFLRNVLQDDEPCAHDGYVATTEFVLPPPGTPALRACRQTREGCEIAHVESDAPALLRRRTPTDRLDILLPLDGTLLGSGAAAAPGMLLLLSPGRLSHLRVEGAARWIEVRLPSALLAAARAGDGLGVPPGDLLLLGRPDAEALASVRARLLDATAPSTSLPELFARVLRDVCWTVPASACQQQRAVTALDALVTREPRASRFRLPSGPLRVADRTLRLYCRTVLALSPCQYARLRRLHLARAALLVGGEGSVTAVAMRFGFTELGRFAAYYREAFGETPSQTLRRAAPPA